MLFGAGRAFAAGMNWGQGRVIDLCQLIEFQGINWYHTFMEARK